MDNCNTANCPCKKINCKNFGKCCKCITHHRKINSLPACMREIAANQD